MGLFAPTRVQVPFSGRHQCLASMGTAIVPYPAQHYNSLPTIEDTGSSLKPPDIEQLAATVGQVFAKHQFWSFFRLILLYNHFSLDQDQILVNTGSVAIPWRTPSLVPALHDVKGSSWRLTN